VQEYGVLFLKGLLKGLRPFRAGALDEPMLYECWNLIPTETGLVGHDYLLPIGIPAVGFEYMGIYDQSQFLWFWSVGYDGNLEIWDRVPTHPFYEIKNITPELVPWWAPLEDEIGSIWYLYPNIDTGQPILSTTQPLTGESSLETDWHIRSIFFEYWQYQVNSILPTYLPLVWREI
jgi:hypothetical protein